jgi:hypothetical protein
MDVRQRVVARAERARNFNKVDFITSSEVLLGRECRRESIVGCGEVAGI